MARQFKKIANSRSIYLVSLTVLSAVAYTFPYAARIWN